MRFLLLLLTTIVPLTAQVNVLLVGSVKDSLSGEVVGNIFYRIYTTGANPRLVVKGTVKQNGSFQALLRSGHSYQIEFTHYTILRTRDTIQLVPAETFEEVPRTFTVLRLKPDLLLQKANIFVPNSAELTPDGEKLLKDLLHQLRYNRQLFLKVVLPANPGVSKELLQQRLNALKQWYARRKNNFYVRRLQFLIDPAVRDTVDIQIKVATVRNLFD